MTDFRALCAELLAEIDDKAWGIGSRPSSVAIDRARAALDQPAPVPPTDDKLLSTYATAKRGHCYEGPDDDWPNRAEREATVCGLRAVLACYGRPADPPAPDRCSNPSRQPVPNAPS